MNNSSGRSVSDTTTRYLPYGERRTTPTTTLTERGYTGHHENRDIGLTYMNARYYIPGLGRFLTADTLVPAPANPQSHNRYTYVLGNSLRYTDPTGHECYDPSSGEMFGTCTTSTGYSYSLFDGSVLPPPRDRIFSMLGEFGIPKGAIYTFSDAQLLQLYDMLRKAFKKATFIRSWAVRHVWVQWHFYLTNPGIELEVEFPGAGPTGRRSGFADVFRRATGEIWEVKSIGTRMSVAETQLRRYIANCIVDFCQRGTPVRATVRTVDPMNVYGSLYYSSYRNGAPLSGLIFYWTDKQRGRALSVAYDPVAISVITVTTVTVLGGLEIIGIGHGGGLNNGLQPLHQ
ncbi:MAG: RHS repeat-associated core domain-containing protein [Anaerolineae bacterium]|nr:RHS repeat-associated core domain-containing protein [Anaerolineae bacterium]